MNNAVDFKKTLDCYRARRGQFRIVSVPALHYLMIDGHGDPNTSPAFAEALEALYPVAYALKFASKRERERDYVVMPLEGLWWADDMDAFTAARDKSRWDWTMMTMVPDWLGDEDVAAALARVEEKKRPTRLGDVRFATLEEGASIQTLHVGSFDTEGPVLQQMHDVEIPGRGLSLRGVHHEVHFSDVRRTPPDRQRTLLRQPVADAANSAE